MLEDAAGIRRVVLEVHRTISCQNLLQLSHDVLFVAQPVALKGSFSQNHFFPSRAIRSPCFTVNEIGWQTFLPSKIGTTSEKVTKVSEK